MMFDGCIQYEWAAFIAKGQAFKTHQTPTTITIPEEQMDIPILKLNLDLEKSLCDVSCQSNNPTPETKQNCN